ncbi:MAG: CAP domain-containing protein, partial [bacterium]|nr:CAP domain-containing protein [bacterium]
MLKRTLLVAIIALALALVAGTAARQWLNNNQSPLASPLAEIKDILSADFQKEILAPPPLRLPFSENAGQLTSAGILRATNLHRGENNVAALTANTVLDKAAQAKLADMFAKQYFEHVSPDGAGPGDVVENAGYQFIRVGENLALGNFADDTELVQAWMDSPGHRANILYSGFSQIGIATTRGTYEGQQVWIAVQEFGLPLSA